MLVMVAVIVMKFQRWQPVASAAASSSGPSNQTCQSKFRGDTERNHELLMYNLKPSNPHPKPHPYYPAAEVAFKSCCTTASGLITECVPVADSAVTWPQTESASLHSAQSHCERLMRVVTRRLSLCVA
jgi:hypothetical protein